MAIIIAIITIILYIILIAFSWHNLSILVDKKLKVAYILIGLIAMFISTLIVFHISAGGVEYQNPSMVSNVRNIILAVFVPVNGLIVMPYLASKLSKITSNEITQEQFSKKLLILVVVFIVILIIECSYFKNIQLGIINLMNKM